MPTTTAYDHDEENNGAQQPETAPGDSPVVVATASGTRNNVVAPATTDHDSPVPQNYEQARLRKVQRAILIRGVIATLIPIQMYLFEDSISTLLVIVEIWLVFSTLHLVRDHEENLPLFVGRLPATFLLSLVVFAVPLWLRGENCSREYLCKPETNSTLQETGWVDGVCWIENVFPEDELGCRNTTSGCNFTELCAPYQ